MAQRFLYCVGEPELAARAADRAMVASEEADDPLLLAVSAWTSCMAALAGGRFEEAWDIAESAADLLGPLCGSSPEAVSLQGSLQLFAAIGYAKACRPADAWRAWDRAFAASETLGPVHHNSLTMFGQANVGIYAVAIDIETGKTGSGLTRARKIEDVLVPSTNRRAQHRLEVARGHWTRGEHSKVVDALCESELESAETILYSPFAREIIVDLLGATRARPDRRLLGLAQRVHAL